MVATSRKPESLQEELNGKYNAETLKRVLAIKLDVTQPDDVKAAFAKAIEKFGRVDVVVKQCRICKLSFLLSRVYEINSRLIYIWNRPLSPKWSAVLLKTHMRSLTLCNWGPVYICREVIFHKYCVNICDS